MRKLHLLFMAIIVLLGSALPLQGAVAAAQTQTEIGFDQVISGELTDGNLSHRYTVTLEEAGRLTVNLNSYFEHLNIRLYDHNQGQIWDRSVTYGEENNPKKWMDKVELEPGKYTIEILGGSWGDRTGKYNFTASFAAAKNMDIEPNNGTEIAQVLKQDGQNARGYLSWNDQADYYRINLPKAGKLTIDASSYIEHIELTLMNDQGQNIWNSSMTYGKDNDPKKWTKYSHLEAGTYFLKVNRGSWGDGTGVYLVGSTFDAANNTEVEPNNGSDIAQELNINANPVKGLLSWSDADDFYTFDVSKKGKYVINISSYFEHLDATFMDENKQTIRSASVTYGKENDPKIWKEEFELEAGTYYIQIKKGSWGDNTGNYTLTVQDPALLKEFSDVTDRYNESVNYLVQKGITQGLTDTKFGVGNKIKRIDAAIMIARALSLNTNGIQDSGFGDVPSRGRAAVNALVANKIVSGKSKNRFGSNDYLTRGEMAIILSRAYELDGEGVSLAFSDVADRYVSAVKALVKYDITQGKSTHRYGTGDPITRGEMAIFLFRSENN